jgi:hypothetical protein
MSPPRRQIGEALTSACREGFRVYAAADATRVYGHACAYR